MPRGSPTRSQQSRRSKPSPGPSRPAHATPGPLTPPATGSVMAAHILPASMPDLSALRPAALAADTRRVRETPLASLATPLTVRGGTSPGQVTQNLRKHSRETGAKGGGQNVTGVVLPGSEPASVLPPLAPPSPPGTAATPPSAVDQRHSQDRHPSLHAPHRLWRTLRSGPDGWSLLSTAGVPTRTRHLRAVLPPGIPFSPPGGHLFQAQLRHHPLWPSSL